MIYKRACNILRSVTSGSIIWKTCIKGGQGQVLTTVEPVMVVMEMRFKSNKAERTMLTNREKTEKIRKQSVEMNACLVKRIS